MTIQSETMPRIIYSIDCLHPYEVPEWVVAAFDITLYQSQGVLINEFTTKWSAAETNVVREIPYRFQNELKEIVIKSRGEWLDYFKRKADHKRWKAEHEPKPELTQPSNEVNSENTENTTGDAEVKEDEKSNENEKK